MINTILYLITLILFIISFYINKEKTFKALKTALKSFENIMPQFLSIIIIIGIILSSINATTISSLIGDSSGIIGILFSLVVGSITIMPTFVAFSTCSTLLQNGAGFAQIGALVSTLTLVGIITFSLESKYIGRRAAFLRNFISFLFSFIVAIILGKVMTLL